jgi:hypothetical protein
MLALLPLRIGFVVLIAASLNSLAASTSFTCAVTVPNPLRSTHPMQDGNYGNEFLATGLWPEGKVIFKPGGAGAVLADGPLEMKFWWWRLVKGNLTIEGRRLDGPASSLRADIPQGYGDIGFQATGLIFPTPGCWEVTGHVGHGHLTFVTQVVKIGDGPSWRPR